MWARIIEIFIGIWLIISHFLFQTSGFDDLIAGGFIILFASLSFVDRLNKMHLCHIFPTGWLLYLSYSYPTPYLPFFMQNYILSALNVLMFAIIPSHASDHPRPWKKFLKNLESRSKD
ncbi:MAG: hypothetical protein COT85_00380 [Chlamydiae bacterium CG10_big_fil_rev_8_21_14_0_10_42_34]|nr:MAG: hypothetical protein COT85_00380 [Chlamydiae bacterium CG10_big_fil_rev_8_21_14_0_10_42_34]